MTFKPKDKVAYAKKPKILAGVVVDVLTSGIYKNQGITKKNPVVRVNNNGHIVNYWESELVKFEK